MLRCHKVSHDRVSSWENNVWYFFLSVNQLGTRTNVIRPQYAPSCSVLAYQAYRYGIYYSSEKPLNWIIATKYFVFVFVFFSICTDKLLAWPGSKSNAQPTEQPVGGRSELHTKGQNAEPCFTDHRRGRNVVRTSVTHSAVTASYTTCRQ